MALRDFLIASGSLAAALTAIATVIAAVWLAFKKPLTFCTKLYAAFQVALTHIEEVKHELTTNGGSSLKDLAISTNRTVGLVEHRQFVESARTNQLLDEITSPRFECEPGGSVARVNSAFVRAFGYQPEMLIGDGYVSLLTDGDRERYMNAWIRAVKDRRQFRTDTTWLTQSGNALQVKVIVEPSFDERTREVLRWFGRVEMVTSMPGAKL